MGLILMTTDDGYDSLGFQSLYNGMKDDFDVFVSAPRYQQSGSSHSLTLRRPIRVQRMRDNFFVIDGTPTDCVLLAYHDLIKEDIALVVAGINHGPNMGSDVFYSGTVAAALQSGTLGIKRSAAISLAGETFSNFKTAVDYSYDLIKRLLELDAKNIILNVNIPDGDIKGERVTRMGKRIYKDKVIRDTEKNGVVYSVIDGVLEYQIDADTDFEAVEMGCVSITPLKLDLTDYDAIKTFKGMFGQPQKLT